MASQNAKIYDQTGKETGTFELPEAIFAVEVESSLIHQVVIAQQANARVANAHTKGRSEVRGGGRKPWRQKGTGRARHGSIRSPLWAGGGVTFGPTKFRSFGKKINKKMKQKALKMVLTDLAKEEKIVLVDDIKISGKTQEMVAVLTALPWEGKRAILSFSSNDPARIRACKNLQYISSVEAKSLNIVDLLKTDALIMTKQSMEDLIALLKA